MNDVVRLVLALIAAGRSGQRMAFGMTVSSMASAGRRRDPPIDPPIPDPPPVP